MVIVNRRCICLEYSHRKLTNLEECWEVYSIMTGFLSLLCTHRLVGDLQSIDARPVLLTNFCKIYALSPISSSQTANDSVQMLKFNQIYNPCVERVYFSMSKCFALFSGGDNSGVYVRHIVYDGATVHTSAKHLEN